MFGSIRVINLWLKWVIHFKIITLTMLLNIHFYIFKWIFFTYTLFLYVWWLFFDIFFKGIWDLTSLKWIRLFWISTTIICLKWIRVWAWFARFLRQLRALFKWIFFAIIFIFIIIITIKSYWRRKNHRIISFIRWFFLWKRISTFNWTLIILLPSLHFLFRNLMKNFDKIRFVFFLIAFMLTIVPATLIIIILIFKKV